MYDLIATAQLDHSLWMNVVDSLRELFVLTIAGIIVYKMDHADLIKRGTSKLGSVCDISKKSDEQEIEKKIEKKVEKDLSKKIVVDTKSGEVTDHPGDFAS
jgi:hypothetical protein